MRAQAFAVHPCQNSHCDNSNPNGLWQASSPFKPHPKCLWRVKVSCNLLETFFDQNKCKTCVSCIEDVIFTASSSEIRKWYSVSVETLSTGTESCKSLLGHECTCFGNQSIYDVNRC